MLRRRDLLSAALLATAGLGAGALASGCGKDTSGAPPAGPGAGGGDLSVVTADLERAAADPAALAAAVTSVLAFTADLYRRAAAEPGNQVCSPYSVAVALGMTRAGARGRTAEEMDAVLHTPAGPEALHAGLNALALHVEGRAGEFEQHDDSVAEIVLDVANSLWGQRNLPWEQPFLDLLARYYGTGMRIVDYVDQQAREGAAKEINAWVSERTHERIPELVASGDLTELTRLVLVNAIYLRAPWLTPFQEAQPAPFTRADGSVVQAPTMSLVAAQLGYATGPGWQAVDIPYVGGQLAMAVVLPDPGRLAAVEAGLDGSALRGLLTGFRPAMVDLDLPRWKFRRRAYLGEPLEALGMRTAFTGDADLSGMTTAEHLLIDKVIHEAFIAVDEQGTEAAAATAVIARALSAVATEAHVTVDRPFLFVIHDRETAAPLFVGRVVDPTAD
ncbi:serpin family protein [Frankia sp. CNm7]|uniref:Serpin family protein n=1 Tax=Frankia nepalensis TaxID=1836974 RepID=A0A937UMZ2_9ACTN|nr:serpin family protein [Frankia nepalensis]MBL7496580.1 serpin family protein [Frankia nepalensis]MBL7508799.1 serpin family protein [Frankia nepalensis]MBL7518946.1 serpin family protein [Frankia nepalensis]MBL7627553.1 serpin family protein [Frankia nepalensis]